MPVSANTVWEIRSTATANMVNGGGFVTGAPGTNYSQQDAAQYALTGVTSAGAGNTVLSASAATDMVGNIAKVVSGTNFTQGWFEITSVVAGVSITFSTNAAGTAICTGIGAAGVINIGGALSLNSTLDDDFFEEVQAGNTVWIKSGTYSLGESVTVASAVGTGTNPINLTGYNSTRGDSPMVNSGSQPIIACGANDFQLNTFWIGSYLEFTTTTAAGVVMSASQGTWYRCKVTNTSTTSGRVALSAASNCSIIACEGISQNGTALRLTSNTARVLYSYAHDSRNGIELQSNTCYAIGCVVNRCFLVGIELGASALGNNVVANCTVRGFPLQIGTGLKIPTATGPSHKLYNNVIMNWATGVAKTSPNQASNFGASNCFYNNKTDVSNYTKDATDFTADPGFTGIVELTGTTATTSGSVLTDSGADFSSVRDNIDFLYVNSGTGVTTGQYLITSHTSTTLTVNNTLGTSSAGNVVYTVSVGQNFAPGPNLANKSIPLQFGDESPSNIAVGAVQRKEVMPSSTFIG